MKIVFGESTGCNRPNGWVASEAAPKYLRGMSEKDVERYRAKAAECLDQADRALGIEKEAWLKLAEQWIILALQAEKRL
jgi:hypothetical protein